jgi:hypothetical protein
MSSTDMEYGERRSGGLFWFWAPILLILVIGFGLSIAAFASGNGLTIAESLAAGFGGLAGILVGLVAAVIGVFMGLIGALLGVAVAGGAVAMTLFIVASPILAIILFVLLLRRPKSSGADCPDPAAH